MLATPTPYQIPPKKAKAKNWFYHDGDAHRDPKIISLIRRGDYQFYGYWWATLELLRETIGYKIPSDLFLDVLYSVRIESKAHEFLTACLDLGLLTQAEGFIFSPTLIGRMSDYDAKCALLSANAKQKHSKCSADAKQTPTKSDLDPDLDPDPDPDPIPNLIPIPDPNTPLEPAIEKLSFPPDTPPKLRDALNRWATHLKKNHRRDFDQIKLEAVLIPYALRYDDLIDNLNYSIANGWKTICEKPPDVGKAHATTRPLTGMAKNVQDGMDLMMKYKKEGI